MLGRGKWLVGLFIADPPTPSSTPSPPSWILETKAPLLSGEKYNLQRTDRCLLNSQALHDQNPAEKYCFCFLVPIRKTKSIFFEAFHFCNLQTSGRKEFPRQTQPQKCKGTYLLSRTEIQSRRWNWDSEVHPNLLCMFSSECYPPSIQETSANCFDSPILSGSASVAFILHNSLYFIFFSVPYFLQGMLPFPYFFFLVSHLHLSPSLYQQN